MNSAMLLVLVFIFLVVMFLSGYEKGIIKIALSLISVMLSLLVVSGLTPLATKVVKSTSMYDNIYTKVDTNVKRQLGYSEYGSQGILGVEEQKRVINIDNMPDFVGKQLEEKSSLFQKDMTFANIIEEFSKSLTDIIVNAIVYVVLFIIINVALRVVTRLLNLVSRLPILNTMNRIIGGALGLGEGLIIIWLVCLLIMSLQGTGTVDQVITLINGNQILKNIYDNNLLISMFSGIL